MYRSRNNEGEKGEKMTRKITLLVNNTPVEIDYFVQNFLDHTIVGMVSSLEGVKEIRDLEVFIEEAQTRLLVNGSVLPTNEFVNDLFRKTLLGLLSALKNIPEIRQLTLGIQR
jgi:hypothetical protein